MLRKLLMCPPYYYDVAFHLQNVHMKMSREVIHNKAQRQWINLYNLLVNDLSAQVYLTTPAIGMLDMVFTANAGLIKNNKAIVSHFSAHARKGETAPYYNTLDNIGFDCFITKNEFEGQGDALFSHNGDNLWIGHGFRTNTYSHPEICNFFDMKLNENAFSLKLIQPEFYHLDTCFCPLDNGHLLIYPQAFTPDGISLIYDKFKQEF